MPRSRLIRAIAILFLLYGGIGCLVFLLMPSSALSTLYQTMPSFMHSLPPPDSTGINAMADWQRLLLATWTGPVLLIWLAAILFGILLATVALATVGKRFQRRGRGSKTWAGTTSTLGPLLTPRLPHAIKPIEVACPGVTMNKAQQAFVDEAVGLIAAKPDTFTGDGHGTGLYEHTLNVIEAALDHSEVDASLVMAAASHDIGKLTSYTEIDGSPQKIRDHGIEGGRLMKLLPSFHALDKADAETLFPAVRYEHADDQIPIGTPESARLLRERLMVIDGTTTAKEKEQVLSKRDPEAELIEAFDVGLGSMPFYRKGLARGTRTVGMRKGRKLYMNEIGLRDWLSKRLDRDFSAALGKIRYGGEVHVLTQHLLRQFYARGWLVTRIETNGAFISLPPEVALWTIESGSQTFNGVFILRIPEDSELVMPEAVPYIIKPVRPATAQLQEMSTVEAKAPAQDTPEPRVKANINTETESNGQDGGPAPETSHPETDSDQGSTASETQEKPRSGRGRKKRTKKEYQAQAQQAEHDHSSKAEANSDPGPWTEAELQVLEQHKHLPHVQCAKEVARVTKRSKSAVLRKLDKMGVPKTPADKPSTAATSVEKEASKPSGRWSDEEITLIETNLNNGIGMAANIQSVVRVTGRSSRSVERKVKKWYSESEQPFANENEVEATES